MLFLLKYSFEQGVSHLCFHLMLESNKRFEINSFELNIFRVISVCQKKGFIYAECDFYKGRNGSKTCTF